jgi:hypothetical protein
MNAVLRLENGIEYKFVLCAAISLAPLTAAGLDPLTAWWPKFRWALVLIVPMLLAPFMLSTTIAYMPWDLPDAPCIDESSFGICLDPSESHALWTRAVRDSTPADTVLVVHKPALVFSAYTNRSLYVVGPSESFAGYGLTIEENLLDIRGYPAEVYEKRLCLVERLYTDDDPAELSSCLAELKKLKRPIAIHFSGGRGNTFLKWLRDRRIGRELVTNGRHLVWYIHYAPSQDVGCPPIVSDYVDSQREWAKTYPGFRNVGHEVLRERSSCWMIPLLVAGLHLCGWRSFAWHWSSCSGLLCLSRLSRLKDVTRRLMANGSIIGEFLKFRKQYWLIAIVLTILGASIVFTESGVMASFINVLS